MVKVWRLVSIGSIASIKLITGSGTVVDVVEVEVVVVTRV
jgi:hypothetical protein